MKWRLLGRRQVTAESRAITLLGVVVGLLVGCGLLGLFGIGVVVYFAAWLGDFFRGIGEAWRKGAMLFGFFLGFFLYVLFWASAGAGVAWVLSRMLKVGPKHAA